jgi:hypothetical protein
LYYGLIGAMAQGATMAFLRAVVWLGTAVFAVMLTGCIQSMKMPSAALRVSSVSEEPSGQDSPFREVARISSINGSSEFVVHSVWQNADASMFGIAATVRFDSEPGEPEYSAGHRTQESGIVIWTPVSATTPQWIAVPSDYGEKLGGTPRVLAFSPDNALVAIERDERVMIWSRPRARVISTFGYGVGKKIAFPPEGGSRTAATTSITTAVFSDDNARLSVTMVPGGRKSWSTVDGALIEQSDAAPPQFELGGWSPLYPLEKLEGVGPGNYVSPNRQGDAISSDGEFVAVAFARGMYYLGGDATPSHVRVWNTRTGKLQTWLMQSKGSPSAYGESIRFLANGHSLLVVAPEGLRVIDVTQRRETARLEDVQPRLWIPCRGQVLCTQSQHGIVLLEIDGYGTKSQ